MILLDTHALLWLYLDSPRLGREARELVSRSDAVAYSSVSVAEIVIKHMLGRLEMPGDGDLPRALAQSGLLELPLTGPDALAMLDVPELARHDPFDRFIYAQALHENCTLLTADATLLTLGSKWVRDARV